MKPGSLHQLEELSQALQDADAAKLKVLRSEEQKIRTQLAQLSDTQQAMQDLPGSDLIPQRRVGGDILWHVWVSRRRHALHMELARCLARQGTARQALKKSFGKCAALGVVRGKLQSQADHAQKVKSYETITGVNVLGRQ